MIDRFAHSKPLPRKPQQLMEILVVDDAPSELILTQEALKEMAVASRVHAAHDGQEALDFLYRRGKFSYAVRPHIILIDLSMPKKTGKEVLLAIKQDADLKGIPVIVFTCSSAPEDISDSYRLHANAYIIKPSNPYEFSRVMAAIENFWLHVASLPPHLKGKGAIACAS